MRPSCSSRGLWGQGSAPGFLHSPSEGGDLGTRVGGCSPPCFLLLSLYPTQPPGSLGGPQAQLPYLGAFSPARSQHAPLRVLSSLTATWGPVCPFVSPSTSVLSLVLSHGDFGGRRARVPVLGRTECPQGSVREERENGAALPLPARHGRACPSGAWDHGTPSTHQKAEAKAPARLRATESGGGHTPFLLLFAGSDL